MMSQLRKFPPDRISTNALVRSMAKLQEAAARAGHNAARCESCHNHRVCPACLDADLLPHDPTTCADFDGGEHCVTLHVS